MKWGQIVRDNRFKAVAVLSDQVFEFECTMADALASGLVYQVRDEASATDAGGSIIEEFDESQLVMPLKPGKFLCVGLNFTDHAQEVGAELPKYPTIFTKFSNALIGPHDHIQLPDADASTKVDWEAELAVVVGKSVRNVDRHLAQDAIFGYTVCNDISVRDWQGRTSEWFQGKNWDSSTPLGPVIVPADQKDVASGLRMTCSVDGEVRQNGNTANMVFLPAEIIAYLSQFMTLEPGDVIITGTPAGVGLSLHPRKWLEPGQVVETEIEGIGILRNKCI